ncbi:hypothetical protein HETIRDRAFT_330029, partial [Heterobasidion irregulare TC 32-1]
NIPFHLTSATLLPAIYCDVLKILQINLAFYLLIQQSNNRTNILLAMRKLQHPLYTFQDLVFLIPNNFFPDNPPKKFLIFFDKITDLVKVSQFLHAWLPMQYCQKIKWFNAHMTEQFHETELQAIKDGDIWGLLCTNSFGMGIDLPDIELVIQ